MGHVEWEENEDGTGYYYEEDDDGEWAYEWVGDEYAPERSGCAFTTLAPVGAVIAAVVMLMPS